HGTPPGDAGLQPPHPARRPHRRRRRDTAGPRARGGKGHVTMSDETATVAQPSAASAPAARVFGEGPIDSEFAIETKGLTKRLGHIAVVDGLDLVVPTGSVYGFLGPNGSGKTTTNGMLVGGA